MVPGLSLLALELSVLTLVGFAVSRVLLRQSDDLLALAQGMAVGLALWGLIANFAMYLVPGLAGGIAAWVVAIGIGAGLAWRAPGALRVPMPTSAIFVATALLVFWLALAGRQLLSIADDEIHHGLAASIRAGGFPPVLPWNPGQPAPYHYAIDMLAGLLMPPSGPDLAFVNELLGAYIWTSLALVAMAVVYKHAGWLATVTLSPLLLTAGAWTLFGSPNPPSILQVPVPTGAPGVGLRTALSELYWPSFELPFDTNFDASPPNSWRPSFPLAYTLAFIVLERIAAGGKRSWTSNVTLAALLGFVGLVDEPVALIGLGLWIAHELARVLGNYTGHARQPAEAGRQRDLRRRSKLGTEVLAAAAGPALAVVLLAATGGLVTGFITGSSHAAMSLQLIDDPGSRRPLGVLDDLGGGVGLLGIGPFVVAIVALLFAWRSPLVRMLTAGSGLFLVAALVLRYEPFPADISRMDGHARNFTLLALLVAMALRFASLNSRHRYIAALGLVALVTWPTAATPARSLSLALERGPQLSNMSPGPREFHEWFQGRHAVRPFPSDVVARYIRENTPVDARVLSPHPSAMTVATGRPNASGFADLLHIIVGTGPEYKDAIGLLEPTAVRALGINFVHATDSWLDELPGYAVRWLQNPELFDFMIRDGADALYRVRPAFTELDMPPTPLSFQALRRSIPADSSVYLSPDIDALDALRAAAAVPQASLYGDVDKSVLHFLTELSIDPLGSREPDVIVMSSHVAPSAFAPSVRQPIWWNDSVAAYAPAGGIARVVGPPPQHFSVVLSDVRTVNGHIDFRATFIDRAAERWTGQDWVVMSVDASRWQLPGESRRDRLAQPAARWFIGHLQPVRDKDLQEYLYLYRFDPQTATLTFWDGATYAPLQRVDQEFGPGDWVLTARLVNRNREVALIPVLQFTLSASGDWTYEAYAGSLDVTIAR